ncbi:formate dehydrogenase accessory protein FdhE [Methylocapsa aurea]|uniref:formate dehydrogenase accessory protein FdhE n=1 Tax=Methylocapsa aurea TaxID=663610 RepID=UPI000564613B|nr:formate dehydrogenase accessory protein FdhE [Methylocapsa aurea]
MTRKGEVSPDPTAIGDVAAPPFVVLPDPMRLFALRAARLRALAETSALAPYLRFLADLAAAQNMTLDGLPEPTRPDADALARAKKFEMPPLDRSRILADAALAATFDRLFAAAQKIEQPAAAADALARVMQAGLAEQEAMARAVLADALPVEAMAEHVYIAAALQIHFARLAAGLAAGSLVSLGDGTCPACGGAPSATMVVGWPGAHGARFCTCSLCATLWNVVRIKCVLCGSTKGIGYKEIEGGAGAIKAETCDQCRGWVKILHQHKDPGIDPFADDVASLGLDLLMRDGPYRRGGVNPFLAGY